MDEEKNKKKTRKRLLNVTGLFIDMSKANFGNSSRRFFENTKLVSEIKGVSYGLIYRLNEILEVVTKSLQKNTKAMQKEVLVYFL